MALLIRVSLLLVLFLLPSTTQSELLGLCYHEVVRDDQKPLSSTAIRASDLASQFAWLYANGYCPVSIRQIIEARSGGQSLPEQSVLLSFDDGRRDFYTRVFPLLRLFRYPAVVGLVGSWLDLPDISTVDYDGQPEPRSTFLSWDQLREIRDSGLVEIGSHSYSLHGSITANPQGNTEYATISRHYRKGLYENDAEYLKRLRDDLSRNRELIRRKVGIEPTVVVWPYGRYNGAASEIGESLGMKVGLTLNGLNNTAATPLAELNRQMITSGESLQEFAEIIRGRWQSDPARSVSLNHIKWDEKEEVLSGVLDRLLRVAPNIAFVSPTASVEPAASVLFPTKKKPVAADLLNRIAWQIENRTGVRVFIDLPLSWLQEPDLLDDLARQVNFSGVRIAALPGSPAVKSAIEAMQRWRRPLRVAYAVSSGLARIDAASLRPGDLLVVPAGAVHEGLPAGLKQQILVEFDPTKQPGEGISQDMYHLEADGWRQFGIAGLPAPLDPVLKILSLRSKPQLP
jgi:poly-beta-1,6-N-acetyl-D-glucosamine N-deacetylase